MVLVLVTGSVICSCVGESNAVGFFGMTSDVGGGNGFDARRHDRLCWWK